MEVDSPSPNSSSITPRESIEQRLVEIGVPKELSENFQHGLVAFSKENKSRIPQLVSSILLTSEEVGESLKVQFRESMVWLQWLMFEGDPEVALTLLAKRNVGERGACGVVWGSGDLAYRCRTCEHDSTCAICVPCFQNGNHKDHNYSIIYTGGGCCDCGDVTAWKREGFCSNHKGAEQIQPLQEKYANSVGPVIDALLHCWKNKLFLVEASYEEIHGDKLSELGETYLKRKKLSELGESAKEMTFVIVEMLLEFCKHSESLLSFVSRKIFSIDALLDILIRGERFLSELVTGKLHELLLKLLVDPVFKYEFAKAYINYYPIVVQEAIKGRVDSVHERYPLLSTFSVQIFTVPILTLRLVKEVNVLGMLLGCLEDLLSSCPEKDGCLQINKSGKLYETILRVIEDSRFVMSHAEVPKYMISDQRDISKTWMRLLAFLQGMDPQKRRTGLLIEEENENIHLPFYLGHLIANIHSNLADVVCSVSNIEETDNGTLLDTYKQDSDDLDSHRHAKVGRRSQENSVCSGKMTEVTSDSVCHLTVPSAVTSLTFECLLAIENWLRVDNMPGNIFNVLSPKSSGVSDYLALKKKIMKIGKGKQIFSKLRSSNEAREMRHQSPLRSRLRTSLLLESGQLTGQGSKSISSAEVGLNGSITEPIDDCLVEGEFAMELQSLQGLSLPDWPDIIYDVSKQDISVHIPLHRLLSLLLQRALRRCFGELSISNVSGSTSLNSKSAVHCNFFRHVLNGFHPYGFSAFVMEHPLRIKVFCAEVHAGMWRKNGDAAILSSHLYQSNWPDQNLELDIFLLQCCAALAPADLYVQRILERFGLLNYVSLNLQRSSEYEPALLQEMLTLLIQIVTERRLCGLSTAESLKRELIYKLAIGDVTHSQIVKSLPRDLSKSDQLHEILNNIAEYSQPSGSKQGMYSLRWPFWKELDLYHLRWNPRDLQVVEERYSRFCSASAFTTQLPRWTKIYHPLNGLVRVAICKVVLQIIRAVLFYAVFCDHPTSRAPDGVLVTALHLLSLAVDICSLQVKSDDESDYMGESISMLAFAVEDIGVEVNSTWGEQSLLSLLVLLMRMHKREYLGSFMDVGKCDIPTLIGGLLKKFAEIDSECKLTLLKLAPEVVDNSSRSVTGSDINKQGSASDGEKRKAKARERQAAIMAKMKAEQSKFLEGIDSSVEDGINGSKTELDARDSIVKVESEGSAEDICALCHDHNSKNPVSFLVLLQKSRLMSFVAKGPPSWNSACTLGKKQVPIPTSEAIDHLGRTRSPGSSTSEMIPPPELKLVENAVNEFARDGKHGEANAFIKFLRVRFLTVWSSRQPSVSNDVTNSTTYSYKTLEEDLFSTIRLEVLNSTYNLELCKDDGKHVPAKKGSGSHETEFPVHEYLMSLSKTEHSLPEQMPSECISYALPFDGCGPSDCDGIHISSCGHSVHQGCLDRYLTSLKERYNRRIVYERSHVDPNQGEFLCPVCRQLVNSTLPALPREFEKLRKRLNASALSEYHVACHVNTINSEISFPQIGQALVLLQKAASMVGNCEVLRAVPVHKTRRVKRRLEPVIGMLFGMYYSRRMDTMTRSANANHSLVLWDTLRYSLISTEIAARSERTNMTPTGSLDSLYKELRESGGGFILSLLLKIVQKSRHKDPTEVLLRFSGLQLFAASVCSGISVDNVIWSTSERGENIFSILERVEGDFPYPDIHFLKRAAAPILAHDPFSSLMWILFCLPCPFLTCEKTFLSLVHIFYIVSVAQAVITYSAKSQCKVVELDFQDCMITDINKAMESIPNHYFLSNYIDPSCDMKDTIRSLSFPYLRRCVLLSKLVKDFASTSNCEGAVANIPSYVTDDDMQNISFSNKDHLLEVEKLENMFKIPSLDVLLKDEMLRSLVLKWLNHFCVEFEAKSLQQCVLYSSPAVPFKLMNLPDVYQDILQRYIKQCCPYCNKIPEEPALCLLCGTLCSPGWTPCCRVNDCKTHATACGAGTGVFLSIKKTTILLQRSTRLAIWPSLYLDAFGEEDDGVKRGNPLYLNKERYAALCFLVASHGLDRNSKVLHQTTLGFPLMI